MMNKPQKNSPYNSSKINEFMNPSTQKMPKEEQHEQNLIVISEKFEIPKSAILIFGMKLYNKQKEIIVQYNAENLSYCEKAKWLRENIPNIYMLKIKEDKVIETVLETSTKPSRIGRIIFAKPKENG